ncbi:MAG: PHP domain-containing protein, partial [Oscillospiraceae bacterium]
MTPNNIINMASLLGLDVIAVSDHNSAKNLPAVFKLGKKAGITVIPAIEVTTAEEVHVLCLFYTL